MSIEIIHYKDNEIIYYDLEDSKNKGKELDQLNEFNEKIENSKKEQLVLINVCNYMPGINYLEIATKTLFRRAKNIKKAAYVGVNSDNKQMYKIYDKYNIGKVNRKMFNDIESALEWLIR
jgi:hypothetical protein